MIYIALWNKLFIFFIQGLLDFQLIHLKDPWWWWGGQYGSVLVLAKTRHPLLMTCCWRSCLKTYSGGGILMSDVITQPRHRLPFLRGKLARSNPDLRLEDLCLTSSIEAMTHWLYSASFLHVKIFLKGLFPGWKDLTAHLSIVSMVKCHSLRSSSCRDQSPSNICNKWTQGLKII